MFDEFKPNEVKTIDLHGLTVLEAKKRLEKYVMSLSPKIRKVIVIHGSNHGDKIMKMVRFTFKCKRVEKKIIGLNDGVTDLILKKE